MPDNDMRRADVVIAGGGQVGLALAVALKQAAPKMAVVLADAAPPEVADRAGRASTIVAGGRRLLQQLGVWNEVAPAAQPVTSMIVTDSRTQDTVRPVFLTFATDGGGEAEAHVVPDGVVVAALRRAADASGVAVLAPQSVTDFAAERDVITAELGSGDAIEARLLVAADGARSRLRTLAGIGMVGWGYGQSGIVATIGHDKPHGGRAEEHFLPSGPFATLPLTGNRSSLVWTEPTEVAERLVAGDRLVLRAELERRLGHRLGKLEVLDTPRAYPLGLWIARAFVQPRLALVGDAAHTIHPLAGQGLNLGYRDVAALAETLVDAYRLGLDIGSLSTLERYQQWRRYDTVEMGLVTDALNRLFSSDNAAVRLVRDVGLGLVDRLPEVKRWFVGEAAGNHGEAPRLVRGEAL